MTHDEPTANPDKRFGGFSARRVAAYVAIGLVAALAPIPFDKPIWLAWKDFNHRGADWYFALRVLGYLPWWLVLGAAMLLIDTRYIRKYGGLMIFSRFSLIATTTITAGLITETMKILVRRYRPTVGLGEYVFRPWSVETFSSGNMGMPSSHTGIAFAGMGVLCYLYPRASVVWIALAVGCARTRFLNDPHFLSDCTVAAFIGLICARAFWHDHLRRRRLDPARMTHRPFA